MEQLDLLIGMRYDNDIPKSEKNYYNLQKTKDYNNVSCKEKGEPCWWSSVFPVRSTLQGSFRCRFPVLMYCKGHIEADHGMKTRFAPTATEKTVRR